MPNQSERSWPAIICPVGLHGFESKIAERPLPIISFLSSSVEYI